MKSILLVGGNGNVGQALVNNLSEKYHFIVCDNYVDNVVGKCKCIVLDASKYDDFKSRMPSNIDSVVILTSVKTEEGILNPNYYGADFYNAFVKVPYNVFYWAKEEQIPKVIYCSTNHVTGLLEEGGQSKKENGTQINTADAMCPEGLYGALKASGELMGNAYSEKYGITVFNLRIGTYRYKKIIKSERCKRTLLKEKDLVEIFNALFETTLKGNHTYYCVSNNENSPWSTKELKEDFPSLSMFHN